MGKLQFNVRVVEAVLVQYRGRNSPEAVPGHLAFVAHTLQGLQDRVVAHALVVVTLTGEQQLTPAGNSVQGLQHFYSLG